VDLVETISYSNNSVPMSSVKNQYNSTRISSFDCAAQQQQQQQVRLSGFSLARLLQSTDTGAMPTVPDNRRKALRGHGEKVTESH